MNLKIVVIVRKEVIKMKEEKQEKLVGEGVGFDRIRRITGKLLLLLRVLWLWLRKILKKLNN